VKLGWNWVTTAQAVEEYGEGGHGRRKRNLGVRKATGIVERTMSLPAMRQE
jgi:hypothetical protein